MIKCPKCGCEHVSIVTKIKSEQTTSRFLEITYKTIWTIFIFSLFIFIPLLTNSNISLKSILSISTLTEITSSIFIIYIAIKIETGLIITLFINGIILKLMPYEIHSVDKCICHECECKWLRNNEQKEE